MFFLDIATNWSVIVLAVDTHWSAIVLSFCLFRCWYLLVSDCVELFIIDSSSYFSSMTLSRNADKIKQIKINQIKTLHEFQFFQSSCAPLSCLIYIIINERACKNIVFSYLHFWKKKDSLIDGMAL